VHPLLVKSILWPLHERLLGKRTRPWLAELERTQWLAPAALEEYRFARLKRLLEYAYAHVPYYRRVFDEHGIPPRRVQSFDDFTAVPMLTREDVRAHFDELTPRPRFTGSRRFSTGGSTGSPVTLLIDMERMAFSDASRLRAHGWFGLQVGVPEVALWGSTRDLSRQGVLRSLRDRLLNYRTLSAFDMRADRLAQYARTLGRFRPAKIYGYATALTLLAQYLASHDLRHVAGSVQAVFSTAEPLFDYQRAVIGDGLGCRVAEEYGARDAGLVANECPEGGLHVNAEGIHAERIGPADSPGELVITNFDTPAMPIIRYRTQDVALGADGPCACGRTLPLLGKVQGRRTDFLVTPGGKVLHALAVIYVLREAPAVEEFQVVQDALDHVVVNIVPGQVFDPDHAVDIRRKLLGVLGPDVDVDVALVSRIERPESGKYRYVVSAVADQHLRQLVEGSQR
jgi:phenylacetate-CoA ligase